MRGNGHTGVIVAFILCVCARAPVRVGKSSSFLSDQKTMAQINPWVLLRIKHGLQLYL